MKEYTKDAIRNAAQKVLDDNKRTFVSSDGRSHTYTVPHATQYPFQWLWDSCFHAIALTHIDVRLAQEEIRSILTAQRPDGFLPHVIFWDRKKVRRSPLFWHYWETRGLFWLLPFFPKPRMTAHSQPPVLAQAIERIWEKTHDQKFLEEVLSRACAFYRWWAETRDPDRDGLISIIEPFESGMDALPAYDLALGFTRPPSNLALNVKNRLTSISNKLLGYDSRRIFRFGRFQVEDVLVNSLFAQGLRALGRMSLVLGETQNARDLAKLAQRTERALVEKCYDSARGVFWNLAGKEERPCKALTIVSLFPIILEHIPEKIARRVIQEHLLNEKEFWLPYPVPSVAANDPTFAPKSGLGRHYNLWRGGVWVNSNWFLFHALKRWGYTKEASWLRDRTITMVMASKWNEHFDPYTGEGFDIEGFGWSTLIVDML